MRHQGIDRRVRLDAPIPRVGRRYRKTNSPPTHLETLPPSSHFLGKEPLQGEHYAFSHTRLGMCQELVSLIVASRSAKRRSFAERTTTVFDSPFLGTCLEIHSPLGESPPVRAGEGEISPNDSAVGRTEVARPYRSGANRLLAKHGLCILNPLIYERSSDCQTACLIRSANGVNNRPYSSLAMVRYRASFTKSSTTIQISM